MLCSNGFSGCTSTAQPRRDAICATCWASAPHAHDRVPRPQRHAGKASSSTNRSLKSVRSDSSTYCDLVQQRHRAGPLRLGQQRHLGALAGDVARADDPQHRQLGHQADPDRARRRQVRPERPGQQHLRHVRLLHADLLEQQPPPGRDRGLGELQLAHVPLRQVHQRVPVHLRRPARRARRGRRSARPPASSGAARARRAGVRGDLHGRLVGDEPPGASRAARPSPARPPRPPGPEPHSPTGFTSPITCSSSRPSWLTRTTSIAPSAARIPHRIDAASNAGPAGAAVDTSRSALPSTISQLVPTSMNSRSRLSRSIPDASTPATMSPPTYAPSAGNTVARALGCTCTPRSDGEQAGERARGHDERRHPDRLRVDARAPGASSSRCRRAPPRTPARGRPRRPRRPRRRAVEGRVREVAQPAERVRVEHRRADPGDDVGPERLLLVEHRPHRERVRRSTGPAASRRPWWCPGRRRCRTAAPSCRPARRR